ncbi:phosphatidylserine decarboxylase proenzyme, mitochondrial-like isoform X1 [Macrosteles quadrilineatus]|uniref:phosphatidylserine decarboxylase proenzyme, mitochondrial-like isoform X1 n=1 Tax=Macrosteles quadrilineatus TaxID=74068 RepID=UPI0023E124E2|nr:phosphatidylserine decarboxylase proenzyme, mitochondrial-like isoform X1 [Macrosteles quadrilineatus]
MFEMTKFATLFVLQCYRSSLIRPYNQCLRSLHQEHGQNTKLVHRRWRRFWHSWVPISTGVGVSVLAVLQWRRLQRDNEYPEPLVKEFQITCYRSLPLRLWSRTWGWLCNCHVPLTLRSYVYGLYSSMYGVNLDEMAGDLSDYPSLGQFFTRQLKDGTRPIDPVDCIVSPADGKVLNSGRITSCHVEQVKGVTYNLQTFLGPPTWKTANSTRSINRSNTKFTEATHLARTDENDNELVKSKINVDNYIIPETFWGGVDVVKYLFKAQQEQEECIKDVWDDYKSQLLSNPENVLYQAVVYLAPGDYHRFHSPVNWKVNFRRHFQGELMSVNPLIAGWLPGLYSLNERVVYVGQWKHGFFSMTAVGATSVGSVKVYSDKTLQTNTFRWRDGKHKDVEMNCSWSKGEQVGEFRMGSTLVLVFEAPRDYKFNLCPNQTVRVGEPMSGCKI